MHCTACRHGARTDEYGSAQPEAEAEDAGGTTMLERLLARGNRSLVPALLGLAPAATHAAWCAAMAPSQLRCVCAAAPRYWASDDVSRMLQWRAPADGGGGGGATLLHRLYRAEMLREQPRPRPGCCSACSAPEPTRAHATARARPRGSGRSRRRRTTRPCCADGPTATTSTGSGALVRSLLPLSRVVRARARAAALA